MSDSKIYIVGVGMTHFGRHLEASISELLDTAILRAADDAGCTKAAVEAIKFTVDTEPQTLQKPILSKKNIK